MIGLSRDFRNMELSIANRRVGIPRGRALSGKTVGIVGLGGIGGALSRRLIPPRVRTRNVIEVPPSNWRGPWEG